VSTSPRNAKTWIALNVALFAFIAVVDQMVKRWATRLNEPAGIGPIRFFPYGNAGVFGGYLSDLDPWIVRIFFSVLFGFLCLAAALIAHFLAHKRTPILKWGLVVYLSGTLGNAWDRMTRGAVVDYILLDLPGFRGTAFNFADVAVTIGFLLIATALVKEKSEIWYGGEQRRSHWVDPSFQGGFGLMIAIAGFAHFFVIALYSFTFLKVFVGRAGFDVDVDRVIAEYLVGLFILEGAALVLTFGVSVFFSHRLVGPIIAFEMWVRRMTGIDPDPQKRPLRFRKGDYFQDRLDGIARLVSREPAQKPRE
jgi:lipoprotein signal peptidase